MKNLTLFIICIFLFSVSIKAQNFSETIKPNLEKLVSKGELNTSDINWVVSKEHISSISNIHHIYFNQTVNGIKIINTDSGLHLNEKGEIISSTINFNKNTSTKSKGISSPSISAIKAIQLISNDLGYVILEPLKVISKEKGANQKLIISNGSISENNISVNLIYSINENNDLILAWEVSIIEIDYKHSWNVIVDATSGRIIDKKDLILYCNFKNEVEVNSNNKLNTIKNDFLDCQNCYEVVAMPIESPYYGERSIVVNPANYEASPYGWHDVDGIPGAEYRKTRGNNINAYIGTSGEGGYQPNGGELLDFTGYPFNQEFSEEDRQEDASITNLFYWGNIAHDVLYKYGFTEDAGNFQENNYGKGGQDEDSIYELGQVELEFCNAYFLPSPDGGRSFINLNACGSKDGSFDNLVIVHEYVHGLTTRLLGNTCTDDEVPFEGWSDWYGLMLTLSPDDISTTPRGIATYLLGQGAGGQGGRPFPYTTNMDINPQTYDYIKNYTSRHDVGSVWASILWELTWVLIDEYGYDPDIYNFTGDINQDAGNIIALAIVTEGLKIGHCNAGFVDSRNAIISSFNAIYIGEPDCIIWNSFAKRGLGVNAFEGNSDDTTDGWESFDEPPIMAEFDFQLANICLNAPVNTNLGGGLPAGGVYSGLGVLDNNNGETFSFNPSIAGIGIHSVKYEIQDSFCSLASYDEGIIEVINDTIAPEINCPEDITVIIPSGEEYYLLLNFSSISNISDNCMGTVFITQTPEMDTYVGIGPTIIDLEVSDLSGNKSNCSFTLIVESFAEDQESNFDIYPNPVRNEIIMTSNMEIEYLKAAIYDIDGRLIQLERFNYFGFGKNINMENIATGLYFFKIETSDFSFVKRILKK